MLDLAQSKDKEHSRYLCLRVATRKRHLKPSYLEWHREAVMNCHQDERQRRRRRRLRWLPKSLGLLLLMPYQDIGKRLVVSAKRLHWVVMGMSGGDRGWYNVPHT